MSRLSPVNQARWARFRHNRRGYWSLWIFLVLFGLSLCSELIANDKPLLVRYDGSWYFPLLKNYSESDFGGPLASQADYQDPWLKQRLENNGWILWAPIRFGATSINFATDKPFPSPPSRQNWLGTDANGGDVLARILYGTRISVLFGLMLTLCSSVMGVLAGALCPQAASDSVSANASTAEISFFITLTFLVFCSNLSPSIRPSPDVLRSPGNRFH